MISREIDKIKGLNPLQREALKKTCNLLRKQVPSLEKVFLFGSYSRGQAGRDSDIDLLILVGEKASRNLKNGVTAIIYPLELEYELEINPLVINRREWEEGKYRRHPLHTQVEKEGILL